MFVFLAACNTKKRNKYHDKEFTAVSNSNVIICVQSICQIVFYLCYLMWCINMGSMIVLVFQSTGVFGLDNLMCFRFCGNASQFLGAFDINSFVDVFCLIFDGLPMDYNA